MALYLIERLNLESSAMVGSGSGEEVGSKSSEENLEGHALPAQSLVNECPHPVPDLLVDKVQGYRVPAHVIVSIRELVVGSDRHRSR